MNDLADVVQQALEKDKGKGKQNGDAARDASQAQHTNPEEGSAPDVKVDANIPNGDATIHSRPDPFPNPQTPERPKHRVKTDSGDTSRSGHDEFPRLGSPHDSPSTRTGPPRSFSYSFSKAPMTPRQAIRASIANDDIIEDTLQEFGGTLPDGEVETAERPPMNAKLRSEFRGALEYNDPEQREKEREAAERREKKHASASKPNEELWTSPLRWLTAESTHDSPHADNGEGWSSYFEFLKPVIKGKEREKTDDSIPENAEGEREEGAAKAEEGMPVEHKQMKTTDEGPAPTTSTSTPQMPSGDKKRNRLVRAQSLPHMKRSDTRQGSNPAKVGAPRWNRLRSLIPTLAAQGQRSDPYSREGQQAIQSYNVNITDELITGGLAALMLKLWFERDEKGLRRIPVLLHRLRIRISDSLHPLKGNKAVFRIECEYASGAARWVIYRTLKDFVSLHTHYRLSNTFNRNVDALPEFPRTSKL